MACHVGYYRLQIYNFSVHVVPQIAKPKSLWQRLSNALFNPNQKAFRAAATLSLPFFVLGRILFGNANIAAISCFGLALTLLALGGLAERKIRQANQKSHALGKLARFFIFQCKRRPIRLFGPIGVILLILGGALLMLQTASLTVNGLNVTTPHLGTISITTGILVFCFGLFGEIIVFANTKRVKDYVVETFLNATELTQAPVDEV